MQAHGEQAAEARVLPPSDPDGRDALPLFRGLRGAPLRRQLATAAKARGELYAWIRAGRPVPPPHTVKQMTVRVYAYRFGLRILIETGTYYGDMVAAMEPDFGLIYSIELGADLHQRAVERFAGHGSVVLIQGDSGVELGRLLPQVQRPALFWLDGHYSEGVTAKGPKDTPIMEEIDHILAADDIGHVVIIDDARVFGSDPAYPTVADLTRTVRERWPAAKVVVSDDSIRVLSARCR